MEMPAEIAHLRRTASIAARLPAVGARTCARPCGRAAASMADKADAKSESRAESKPVAESPVARADRLFAQGQWAAAARAYRDLLRRDPNNGDAARWRQRLAASEEAASAQAPAAAPAGRPESGADPDQSSRRSTWNGETASGSASQRKTDRARRYSSATAWARCCGSASMSIPCHSNPGHRWPAPAGHRS